MNCIQKLAPLFIHAANAGSSIVGDSPPGLAGRRINRMKTAWLIVSIGIIAFSIRENSANDLHEGFIRTAAPILKQFCIDCHGAEKAKADINLERLAIDPDFADNFKTWELAAEMLAKNEMPPEKKPQPSAAQRQQLISLIRSELNRTIERSAGDPGPVVLRRLTSAEYAYTIQDLTGLDLDLEKMFDSDAVGGAGFSNVGDVQFVQDSTIERYLEAAKIVASHAIIGAGPLQFYRDPGKTGQELSAIHRIQEIYRRHGFRTGAGEGAEAFGLERYPKSFFAAWQYRFRNEIGLANVTLPELAQREGIEVRFLQHIWSVLDETSASFPSAEIVGAWMNLPAPGAGSAASEEKVRAACEDLYALLRNWQTALAANTGDDEESPVLTEGAFRASLDHSFRVQVNWPSGAKTARIELSVAPASGGNLARPAVVWKQPRVFFRQGFRRGRPQAKPLSELVTRETANQLNFGKGAIGEAIDDGDFVTIGAVSRQIEFPVPEDAQSATLMVGTQLDTEHGDDCLVRCVISDGLVEGETVASTGASSALLANPDSAYLDLWKAGIDRFARMLPQVSHREAAPSDRDPIPAPFENTYNTPERNAFHYDIKYHRDDQFLTEQILDDSARRELDQAWIDLLSAFDYYDTNLRFVAKKFKVDLDGRSLAGLDPTWIEDLPEEPRRFVKWLHDLYDRSQRERTGAQSGQLEDAMRFAGLAWRRPLSASEENRLRFFYLSLRNDAGLGHEEALRSLVARILVSPAFLYRLENPRENDGIITLSNDALAGRLSYFLWSSVPDAELRRAAEAGELADPDRLAAQAQRMLRDPKTRRFAAEFFGQWFGFYRFDEYRGIDTGRFTEFTDGLRAAMYDEAVTFFEHIVREDKPVEDVLFADYTFLNRGLADHYGIEAAGAPTNKLVRVDGVNQFHRGGLLEMGAVLAVTSAPLRTSAVRRGDWILRRVLGTPVPTPPADAGSIPADDVLADGRTVRERLEAHRSDASCVNCHSRMDPLGFALEHFDPIGRWRDTYRDGQEIDASGTLNDGTEISGLDDLRDYLRRNEATYHRNLCAKLLGYALGRGELVSDRPLMDAMTKNIASDNRFSNLVIQIVKSRQFRYQHGRGSSSDPTRETSAPIQETSL